MALLVLLDSLALLESKDNTEFLESREKMETWA